MRRERIRVCIDARMPNGTCGGVQQVVMGLASGLSALPAGAEEYVFLGLQGQDDWLKPCLGGACSLVSIPEGKLPFVHHQFGDITVPLPHDGGLLNALGIDVMHFTFQNAFVTQTPSIYHPHDLQHLHLSEFFGPQDYNYREITYRLYCAQAARVACTSHWIQNDLHQQYGLPLEKIKVIPWASILNHYPTPTPQDLQDARERLELPERFLFYPAQTWPHKNHAGLMQALKLAEAKFGERIPVVCSGKKNGNYPVLAELAESLGLAGQIRFLGFVSPLELMCLYGLCTGVVIPTLFEAASFPLWEAFNARKPAAVSSVTSLPEQGGDAALFFNPRDPGDMADKVYALWSNPALRSALAHKGAQRLQSLSWETTAAKFRTLYRQLAGRSVSHQETRLLAEPSVL